MIQAGIGTESHWSLPSRAKPSPKSKRVTSWVIVSARPRAAANPPRVTMIGEKPRYAISTPFISPQATPTARAPRAATRTDWWCTLASEPNTATASTATEPTERST